MTSKDQIRAFLQKQVDTGLAPGAVATVGVECRPVTAGTTTFEGSTPIPVDAIFRIQSMTKIITSVAALRLVEQGRIGLDDPIEPWLPELANRRVLRHPEAELDDTEPARRSITLRHLLTNQSGYGMQTAQSPLQRAMDANRTEAGGEAVALGAQEWLDALASLPLTHHPGEAWRYHHSFALLGILIGRVADGRTTSGPAEDGRLTSGPVGDGGTARLLQDEIFGPLGMDDTSFWVPQDKWHRLPAGYRLGDEGPELMEPAGGGFYAGPPSFVVDHAELVSTAADFHTFLTALVSGELIGPEQLHQLRTDQVADTAKSDTSFYPGFWDGSGWGHGVEVTTTGPHQGRFGWSGGLGTNFFVDPDGTIGILLTQVEMGEHTTGQLDEFHSLAG